MKPDTLPEGKEASFTDLLPGWTPSTCLEVLGRGPGRIVTDHLASEL